MDGGGDASPINSVTEHGPFCAVQIEGETMDGKKVRFLVLIASVRAVVIVSEANDPFVHRPFSGLVTTVGGHYIMKKSRYPKV